MGTGTAADRSSRIRLEAGACAVEVAPAVGGRLAALEVDGWDLVRRDGWTNREWGSFVMAPWVGRLRDGRVRWRDRAWTMPPTEPPHALHGTLLDVPWEVQDLTPVSVRLAAGLGPAWPFDGRVTRTLELRPGRLVDRLEVHADREPFPAIIGWHPWFRRHAASLAGGASSGPVEVRVEAGGRLELDAAGLPTGRLAEPRAEPLDDVLLEVVAPPVVAWPGGPRITLTSREARAWIVYTAHPDGVCVEPVTGVPDGLNGGELAEPPVVEPGRPVVATLEVAWT
jgi:galactose mutarotase-like enzyme